MDITFMTIDDNDIVDYDSLYVEHAFGQRLRRSGFTNAMDGIVGLYNAIDSDTAVLVDYTICKLTRSKRAFLQRVISETLDNDTVAYKDLKYMLASRVFTHVTMDQLQ